MREGQRAVWAKLPAIKARLGWGLGAGGWVCEHRGPSAHGCCCGRTPLPTPACRTCSQALPPHLPSHQRLSLAIHSRADCPAPQAACAIEVCVDDLLRDVTRQVRTMLSLQKATVQVGRPAGAAGVLGARCRRQRLWMEQLC